ncbi:putative reverse transcriptase domain-containing protein [Tanacetum coccineum]|uniref:Reverse transcriptase domain-containing protein n=1 Tax=Tanacetum coccineum TaxID=301880 RepID=A0ABQ4Z8V3_9ASTR
MDSPPQSPNHVFNFPENEEEFEEDPQEDPEEEVEEWDDMDIIEEEEEDPEEDPEEWDDVEAVEQVDEIPHPVTPPRNPTAVPHSSPEQSSESEDNDLANSDEAQDVSPPKSTESGIKGKEAKVLKTEMKKLVKRMGSWDEDFKNEWLYTCKLEKKLCEVEDKVEKKEKEKVEMKKIMPPLRRHGALRPRGSRRAAMERIIADRVAQAIEDHEKKRVPSSNSEGSSCTGGCSHKTFMSGKPHSFNGTEGVPAHSRVVPSLGGTGGKKPNPYFGSENAYKIPWTEFKEMMTTEYCPDTEIQKMEQELWNLTLKGDDIETYINRFHELSLMCPELVPTEKKKIKKFIKGFPERIKGNITSSKPSSLHEHLTV